MFSLVAISSGLGNDSTGLDDTNLMTKGGGFYNYRRTSKIFGGGVWVELKKSSSTLIPAHSTGHFYGDDGFLSFVFGRLWKRTGLA